MKLTPKQKAFADYYIQLGNATEAAIKAGYSKKTAKQMGTENLSKPYLQEYIDKRLKEIESDRIADAKEVMEYLTKGMRMEIEEEVVVTENIGDYMSEAKIMKKKISAKDANKCAELLGKRYAMFTEKQEVQHSGEITQNVVAKVDLTKLSNEELNQLEQIASKLEDTEK